MFKCHKYFFKVARHFAKKGATQNYHFTSREHPTTARANTKNPLRIHCAKVCASSLMRSERLPMYVSKQTFDPRHVSSQFLFAALADCFCSVRVRPGVAVGFPAEMGQLMDCPRLKSPRQLLMAPLLSQQPWNRKIIFHPQDPKSQMFLTCEKRPAAEKNEKEEAVPDRAE
jgi:hypothetical protein